MASVIDVIHEGIAFGREILALRRENLRKRLERAVQAAKQERAKRVAAQIERAAQDYIRKNRP